MAYPQTRSMRADLNEGLTDGKYKKAVTDRGGLVEPATYLSRIDLNDVWFGIHEEQVKMRGDAKATSTPQYVRTPDADPAGC